jgi:hypothetical protein
MKKAIWEAVKEPLRILVLAVIPVILTYLEVINTQWAIIIVAALRLLDKILHDIGKVTENEVLEKGITQF